MKGLALCIAFLAIAAAGVSPVAHRLGAKRHGYFPSLASTLLLLLSAVFFSQSNLSVGWVSSATLLFGTIAFGLVLEFPIVLIVLARIGILSHAFLARRRRWALLVIVLTAIILTPGSDPISPTMMAVVMYVLFEGSLLLIRRFRG